MSTPTDLNTGKSAWRTYTIPGAGEPGNETWKDGKERWKHGGGSVWETATYDPESDTFYQGIGNAGPDWDAEYRPGDNKWAASVLALSPNDGKIKWGYQYTPNDPYDYDEISEHPIINAKVNGEDRKPNSGSAGQLFGQRQAVCCRAGGSAYVAVHRRECALS
jgi:alcohol dehydrogenase (cytochrome c)